MNCILRELKQICNNQNIEKYRDILMNTIKESIPEIIFIQKLATILYPDLYIEALNDEKSLIFSE